MKDDELDSPPSLQYLEQVTRVQPTLHAVLWSLLRSAHDVDDVLQETNVVLWRKSSQYDPQRDFVAWALGIAQMQVLAFRKKQVRGKKLVFDDELVAQLAAEAIEQTDPWDAQRAALSECLQRLPAAQRTLIARRYAETGSVNALAAELGKTPKAVSEMLRRVRAALLTCIERKLKAGAASP